MDARDTLVGPFYNPARNTAASPYQSVNDLRRWFWHKFPRKRMNEAVFDFYGTWGIGWALQDLGVSPYSDEYEGGKNEVFAVDHSDPNGDVIVDDQWYKVDGKGYRATGASYTFSINWEEGVIMGMNRQSPRYAKDERTPPVARDQLPGLSQFSDVAWIIWEGVVKANRGDVKKLRYFVSLSIVNKETKAVILRALNARPGLYPGVTFDRQSPEMGALLGTPNVQGFAYFLIQHKEQLGNMYISKLQVFHGETEREHPCIIMHVEQPSDQKVEVERRDEGTNIIRVHTVRAML
ncbi:hypothetical protein BDW02DRAFT_518517 [Decorospora gaudefroyi]|uniref:Uncharacterized protein n=1 Tax=Decorospora gaudefroyi TaxID=184978 RepID=A0A6A5KPV9_9PLEO|nr:hypothetical protein BDW02DRAFT_518517 [Decorospora gaudefroyi]